MPALHFLIKPASSACNMACKYCFYADVSNKREVPSYGRMSHDTLEALVKKALAESEGSVTFAFQGGEPTMAGFKFYQKLIEYELAHNHKGLEIHHAIQTNGILINEEWAQFFKEHRFLVGLSLDGTRGTHDRNRVMADGEGSFNQVWKTAQLLEQYEVPFNILTVVTKEIARNAGRVFDFYMSKNLRYMQFIPCLDPLGEERGDDLWSLTPKDYGDFLCELFDHWYMHVSRRDFVYVRFFENLVGMLAGYPPESCGMAGVCARQLVIEADGGVYPCDFYVLDKWKIGDINVDSFEEIERNRDETGFIETSKPIAKKCQSCHYFPLCRGGCRRDREPELDGEMSLNYFCESFKQFYGYALPRLERVASTIKPAKV